MSLMMAMNVQEMERVVSEITASRALEDPSGCISDLNQLLNATEGRTFLSKQEGEKALVLIELFDWVATVLYSYVPPTRTEKVFRL